MKRFIAFIVIFQIVFCGNVLAQYNTGNKELDQKLSRIDAEASVNFSGFKANLMGSYDISNNQIERLAVNLGMSAGDIYMTISISDMLSIEVEQVVRVYQEHKSRGWGVMAKELGIKPGSQEFHALKGTSHKKGNNSKSNNSKGKKG